MFEELGQKDFQEQDPILHILELPFSTLRYIKLQSELKQDFQVVSAGFSRLILIIIFFLTVGTSSP